MCCTLIIKQPTEPRKLMKHLIWGLTNAQSEYVRVIQNGINADISLTVKPNVEILKDSLSIIDTFRKHNGF